MPYIDINQSLARVDHNPWTTKRYIYPGDVRKDKAYLKKLGFEVKSNYYASHPHPPGILSYRKPYQLLYVVKGATNKAHGLVCAGFILLKKAQSNRFYPLKDSPIYRTETSAIKALDTLYENNLGTAYAYRPYCIRMIKD